MRCHLALVVLTALPSCLWNRFDEEVVNAPIELLDRPAWILGGYSSVMAGDPERDALMVGGHPLLSSGVIFSFSKTPPTLHPACDNQARCRLLGGPVAAGDRAGGTGCFVYGVGAGPTGVGEEIGLLGGCATGELFKLPLPTKVRTLFVEKLFQPGAGAAIFPGLLSVASAGRLLAAGSPDLSLVMILDPSKDLPSEIPAPLEADGSFAQSIALTGGQDPVLAVGAPSQGRVYIFDARGPDYTPRACLRRPGAYGVVLHGFSDRGKPRLAISDASGIVDVVDPNKLPLAESCTEAPKEAIVDTLRCVEDDKVTGCDGGAFGYALASADLDDDGTPEVIVGAPGLNVRGVSNAGALAIFRLDPTTDQPRYLFLSSSSAEERVGSAVAAFRKDGRLVVASSALDKQKTAIFHCAGSSPSARCN
ncbi:MAG: integrin alpha [Myxococcales bacterium]|nr:integrin alpha [Polyangiaceae bacterium]MDW8249934.1 integrin alpha [Myxococcales bacterium]